MRLRRIVLALLVGILALLAINTFAAEETTKNVVRDKDPAETVDPDGIQDGPDTFPTLKPNPRPPKQRPWRIPSTTPSPIVSEESGELDGEEVVVERPQPEVICDPVSPFACYESLDKCTKKQATDCSTRYPRPPGSAAATLARVIKYEEGRMCAYTCEDRNGELHYVECTPPPVGKPKPKPGDVALPPDTP